VWHCIGHGADAVLFWQWRSALGGQEQYHGCVVAPDGTPRPLYAELTRIGGELARLAPLLEGTSLRTPVAMIDHYPDRWALRGQPHHSEYEPDRHLRSFYAPLRAAGLDVDIVDPADPLGGYRLVVAPHVHILTPAIVKNLVAFVNAGGHLLLGPRSGFKDEHNALLPSRQPGPELAALLGAHVAEFYSLPEPVPVSGEPGTGKARLWAESLTATAEEAEVLLRYGTCNGWLDGQPALVTRRVGAGRISYLGAWLDEGLMDAVTRWALTCAGVKGRVPPAGLEVCRRVNADRELLILVNHGESPAAMELEGAWRSALTGATVASPCSVAGGDVQVLVKE
jgi:beta-galactosidase